MRVFKDKKEAQSLLKKSRERINEIDRDIIDLIYERTALASDIFYSKKYLNKDIFDKKREEDMEKRISQMINEKNLDEDILNNIMNYLRILSKNQQINIEKDYEIQKNKYKKK